MKKVYCLSEDEINFILAKVNDIVFRLSKGKTKGGITTNYDMGHALDSAIEINEFMIGELYDNH